MTPDQIAALQALAKAFDGHADALVALAKAWGWDGDRAEAIAVVAAELQSAAAGLRDLAVAPS